MSDTNHGKAMKQKHGEGFFKLIGKRGGERNVELNGSDHMREIGKRGGEKIKRTHPADYYSTLGRMSRKETGR